MDEEIDEEVLGGMGYTDFLACESSLKMEELIRRSPRGKKVGLLLNEVNKIEAEKVAQMAILYSSPRPVAVSFLDTNTNCDLQHNLLCGPLFTSFAGIRR